MSVDYTANRLVDNMWHWVEGTPSLNVANGNAPAVAAMLGTEDHYCGGMDPVVALKNIGKFGSPTKLVKPDDDNEGYTLTEEGFKPSVRIIQCGRTPEQVERYKEKLIEICVFAIQHDAELSWG